MLRTWNDFAGDLTAYVQKNWPTMHRGAVLMPYINDHCLFALVFGNDLLPAWDQANLEAEMVRQHLRTHEIDCLGFGVSPDGLTWVLVARTAKAESQTQVAQAFQREMMKLTLEEAVRDAWWAVHGGVTPEPGVLHNEKV